MRSLAFPRFCPAGAFCRLKMIRWLPFDWLTKLSFDWPNSPLSPPPPSGGCSSHALGRPSGKFTKTLLWFTLPFTAPPPPPLRLLPQVSHRVPRIYSRQPLHDNELAAQSVQLTRRKKKPKHPLYSKCRFIAIQSQSVAIRSARNMKFASSTLLRKVASWSCQLRRGVRFKLADDWSDLRYAVWWGSDDILLSKWTLICTALSKLWWALFLLFLSPPCLSGEVGVAQVSTIGHVLLLTPQILSRSKCSSHMAVILRVWALLRPMFCLSYVFGFIWFVYVLHHNTVKHLVCRRHPTVHKMGLQMLTSHSWIIELFF